MRKLVFFVANQIRHKQVSPMLDVSKRFEKFDIEAKNISSSNQPTMKKTLNNENTLRTVHLCIKDNVGWLSALALAWA